MRAKSLAWLTRATVVVVAALVASPAYATTIDFEDVHRTDALSAHTAGARWNFPTSAAPASTSPSMNGQILTQAFDVPANQTSIYGTQCFGECDTPNLLNPITVSFSQPINNFFLDVYNGWIVPVTYRVSDNAGNSAEFLLPNSLSGGHKMIGFAATGTVVQIEALTLGAERRVRLLHRQHPLRRAASHRARA